jgi:aminobenzoyl-glutamate transport protein
MPKRNTLVAYVAIALVCAELVLTLLSWSLVATQTEGVRSLLSSEGLRWFFGQYSEVIIRPELIWLILASMAVGVFWHSDIIGRNGRNYRRPFALRVSFVVCVFLLLIGMLLVILPHAVLLSSTGQLWPSPFSRALVPLLSLLTIITSSIYGLACRNFTTLVDIISSIIWGIEKAASLILIYILALHLYESLCYVFL